MPRAPKVCGTDGCSKLTHTSRCDEHQKPSGWSTSPRTASAGRTSTTIWKNMRILALQRDGHQCQIRGPRCIIAATQVDHVIPVSQGGTDQLPNLQSVCPPCHKQKTAREANAGRVG